MLDGRGNVRITDFGLAGLADGRWSGEDVRSGTPAYMSPEQLQGREVTVRSDVYALGLVLYELFTGRRAVRGRGRWRSSRASTATSGRSTPSAIVPDLDPAVERAILRCLEKDRASAAPVGARRGRDALRPATRSRPRSPPARRRRRSWSRRPASTRGCGPRSRGRAWPLVRRPRSLVPSLAARDLLLARAGREERRRRSRTARASCSRGSGTGARGRLGESGFALDPSTCADVAAASDARPTRWNGLRTGDPPVVLSSGTAQSPRPLGRPGRQRAASAGTTRRRSSRGWRREVRPARPADRVLWCRRRSRRAAPASPAPPTGPPLLEARLDPAKLRAVEPQWTPPFFSDARAAWEGAWPERPDIPIRVEAAAYRGRPVWFEIVNPWTRPERDAAVPADARAGAGRALVIALLLGAGRTGTVLARRNVRLGRVDRRGAYRLALLSLSLGMVSLLSRAPRGRPRGGVRAGGARRGPGRARRRLLWLFYLALEPYVRRLRPWTLVSWTRALNGGRATWSSGATCSSAWRGGRAGGRSPRRARCPPCSGQPAPPPDGGYVDALLAQPRLLADLVGAPVDATPLGLGALLLFLILRLATRRDCRRDADRRDPRAVDRVSPMDEALWYSLPARAR